MFWWEEEGRGEGEGFFEGYNQSTNFAMSDTRWIGRDGWEKRGV